MALTASTDLLQRYLSDWQIQLQIWAASGALVDAATEALILETVPASLKDLNGRLSAGDWSDLPRVELLSGSGMGGAIGAWAESTQTIYLNSDWLSGASKEQVIAVLTEEFEHYLGSTLNKVDIKGDGEILFSSIPELKGLSSSVVDINGTSSSGNESKENFVAGSIPNAQVTLLTTREFSSTIFNNSQPVIRCGCSTCMQQASSFDKNFKTNKKWSILPHNPGTLVSTDTWSALPDSNPFINGLMTGSKWGTLDPDSSAKVALDYYFFEDETLPDGAYGYKFTQEETDAAINAMTAYSNVANISFTQSLNFDEANISWASLNSTDSGDGTLGYAYTPENENFSGITTVNYENYFNADVIIEGSIDPGSYYYLTFTHELGHALGLKHPHDSDFPYNKFPGVTSFSDTGNNRLNAGPWTVMTYNDTNANNGFSPTSASYSGFLTGLGAFDIAAVQYLYGANLGANTGNNTYKMSDLNGFLSIWDNGGIDLIDASDLNKSVTIDLRNATLLDSLGGGGFISRINDEFKGFTIAYNSTGTAIIENAKGGSADDILTGNSGNNTLDGQGGIDIAVFQGEASQYNFRGSGVNDLIVTDEVNGRDGEDKLINIEFLKFADKTLSIADALALSINQGNGTPAAITSSTPTVFQEGVTLTAPEVTGDPDGDAGSPNYSYQWFKDGNAITGANTSTYAVPVSGAGTYKVAITYTDAESHIATVDSANQVVTAVNNGNGTPAPSSNQDSPPAPSSNQDSPPAPSLPSPPISQIVPSIPLPPANTQVPSEEETPGRREHTNQTPQSFKDFDPIIGRTIRDITKSRSIESFAFIDLPPTFSGESVDQITSFKRKSSVALLSQEVVPEDRIFFKATSNQRETNRALRRRSNLVYNRRTGELIYDANGKEKGYGEGGGLLVIFTESPRLDKNNFVLIPADIFAATEVTV